MRLSAAAFLMILTTVFLSGCTQTGMAALNDHGASFYGRNGVQALPGNQGYIPTVAAVPAGSIDSRPLDTPVSNNARIASTPGVPFATASNWQWPVQGRVIENYGVKSDGVSNEGIVIAAAEGTPIRAAQPGEVAYVGEDAKNYGNIVILRHADGAMTSYSHTKSIVVRKGDKVPSGSIIAYVGQSGNAKQPVLHFAIRQGRSPIDPMTKLPHQMASK